MYSLGCSSCGMGAVTPAIVGEAWDVVSSIFGGGTSDATRLQWIQRVFDYGRAGHPGALPLLRCWAGPGGTVTADMAQLSRTVTGKSSPKAGDNCNGMATTAGRNAAASAAAALASGTGSVSVPGAPDDDPSSPYYPTSIPGTSWPTSGAGVGVSGAGIGVMLGIAALGLLLLRPKR